MKEGKLRTGGMETAFLEATAQDLPAGGPGKKTDPEEDGRNKEWQDRSRVNLEEVPEGTKTNIDRDFEPETGNADDKKGDKDETAY